MVNKTVWFIFQEASPIGKGAYSRHYYFAKELQKKGYYTKIITSNFHHFQSKRKKVKGIFEQSIEDGVETIWVSVNKYPSAHSYKRIFSWLLFMSKLFLIPFTKVSPPDYIIVSSPSLTTVNAARFLSWYYGKSKLILELRDIWPETLVEVGNISKRHILIRWMYHIEKRAYNKVNYIISTLPFADIRVKEILKDKPFKFRCIPQGVSPIANSKENEGLVSNSIPPDKFIIGYSGTIGASNALETLIKTARSFSEEKISDIHFVLIGDGASLDILTKLANGLSNVLFIPKVPKEDLPKILSKCDVLYDSTKALELYKYGLSRNKWIDYMLASKPMLVSYSGRLSMIDEAKNGLVVKSEDVFELKKAILQLKNLNEEELIQMGKKGKEYVLQNRTFKTLTNELIEVLNDC